MSLAMNMISHSKKSFFLLSCLSNNPFTTNISNCYHKNQHQLRNSDVDVRRNMLVSLHLLRYIRSTYQDLIKAHSGKT